MCNDMKKIDYVYGKKEKAEIQRVYEMEDRFYTSEELKGNCFSDVEAIFSTWGMPVLTEDEIAAYFPNLKYLFYAAGTVQSFARPFLQRGVRVFSAWRANAVPVAEYTLAQILLANKGYYRMSRKASSDYRAAQDDFAHYPGNYGAKIGILGDGAIGSLVIDELLQRELEVYVFSITLTPERAAEKGIHLATLKEIFAECDVISNHLANNDATKKIINYELLASMKPYATFINTGRGAQVDEEALAKVLSANSGMTALLDVTDPEPPEPDNPLNALENAFLTPHIAGSLGFEVRRMAAYMAKDCQRMAQGIASENEVTMKMLEGMA